VSTHGIFCPENLVGLLDVHQNTTVSGRQIPYRHHVAGINALDTTYRAVGINLEVGIIVEDQEQLTGQQIVILANLYTFDGFSEQFAKFTPHGDPLSAQKSTRNLNYYHIFE
jgi:hypothetical protein